MSASDPSAPAPVSNSQDPSRSAAGRPSTGQSKGSSTRLIVLCGILVVALVAAGWDYLVARPAYEATLKKIDELLPLGPDGKANGKPRSELATQDEVRAAIAVAPAQSDDVGMYLVDRYSWRRGLPWLTYDIWVVYDDDEPKTLRDATSKKEESDVYYRTSDRPAGSSDGSENPEPSSPDEPLSAPAPDAPSSVPAGESSPVPAGES